MLLTVVLATLHILFAIAWLGGGVMFGMIIAPALASLTPGASREFFVRIGPRVVRFFQVVPVLTILFGLLLLGNMVQGDWSQLQNTGWGQDISAGMLLAIVALVVSEAGSGPALAKLITTVGSVGTPGGPGPEAIPPAVAKARNLAMVVMVLLLATLVCMAAAGFY